jgi:glycosyltransferase involved in cell wall biosynthesis
MVALQTLRLRCRLAGKPSLVLEVDQNILKRLPAPFAQVRRAVLRRTDFVLGRSDDAIRVVQACGYRGPSARIGYGIDQSTFRPANRDASRAQLRFHGFTVGYVGRLIEEKGIDDLIEAVGRTTLPLTLAIMGEGPHRDALLQRCAARGIADRLRLMPWGPPEEVARFMCGLDVLALLTRTTRTVREQFGRVIIEAQACGTPVIGTCCGAIPEVIGDGGWIVPERDPATVTSLLERLAHRPAELFSARICAARQIAERFTFTAQARKLMTAWQVAARAAA